MQGWQDRLIKWAIKYNILEYGFYKINDNGEYEKAPLDDKSGIFAGIPRDKEILSNVAKNIKSLGNSHIENSPTLPKEIINLNNLEIIENVKLDLDSTPLLLELKNLRELSCISFIDDDLECEILQEIYKIKSLEYLDMLYHTDYIPKGISNLSNLKSFSTFFYTFNHFPLEICTITSLEELYISIDYGGIPKEISNLKNLKVLHIEGIKELPKELFALQNLQSLTIHNPFYNDEDIIRIDWQDEYEYEELCEDTEYLKIPNSITNLINLEYLEIDSAYIDIKLDMFAKLPKLKSLHLRTKDNIGIIDSIKHIEKINIESNNKQIIKNIENIKIDSIDKLECLTPLKLEILYLDNADNISNIEQFKNLKSLRLKSSVESLPKLDSLTSLSLSEQILPPSGIFDLKNLESLTLDYEHEEYFISLDSIQNTAITMVNEVFDIEGNTLQPPIYRDFFKFSNLKSLNIYYNSAVTLGDEINNLARLESLSINSYYGGRIIFPSNFKGLKNLKKLELNISNLVEIPNILRDLANLETLRLSIAPLNDLPLVIKDLKNLQYLYINEVKNINMDLIKHIKLVRVFLNNKTYKYGKEI